MLSPRIVEWRQIEPLLGTIDMVAAMERAFVGFSAGRAIVPPVGELLFDRPRGEAHIKYGRVAGDRWFLVKIATGFYDNHKLGLPPFSGAMLLFSALTGALEAILLDEGNLTNIRTAAAGAAAARHLANRDVERIGICGTGVQARLQLLHLGPVTPCKEVVVWGRSAEEAHRYASDMAAKGYRVEFASTPAALAARADLIVTTTASEEPYLMKADVRPGTHITAMGSDTPAKCELDPALVAAASVIAVDSRAQCRVRGEAHHALEAGTIDEEQLTEIGEIIAMERPGRRTASDISIADLTGVAVQDIEAAKAVMIALEARAERKMAQ